LRRESNRPLQLFHRRSVFRALHRALAGAVEAFGLARRRLDGGLRRSPRQNRFMPAKETSA
jgi:hypothetical protein